MGYLWDIFRISLGYLLDIFGTSLGCHLDIFRISLGYLWDIFGIALRYLWDIFEISLGYLWDIFGISLSERTSGVPPVIFIIGYSPYNSTVSWKIYKQPGNFVDAETYACTSLTNHCQQVLPEFLHITAALIFSYASSSTLHPYESVSGS